MVGGVNQTLLEQNAVAGPDFTPEDSAPGVDTVFGPIAGKDTSAVRIDAGGAPGLVGAYSIPRGGLQRPPLHGRCVRRWVCPAQGNGLGLGNRGLFPGPGEFVQIKL